MDPTQQQLNARLNPTPVTFNLPKEGQVFRAVGDNTRSTLYKVEGGKLINIGQPKYTAQTKFSVNGQVFNPGDILDFNPRDVTWLDPSYRGGATSTISAGDVYEKQFGAGSYSALPEFNIADINTVISQGKLPTSGGQVQFNTQPNQLASPEQIAQAQQATQQQLNQDPNRVINQTTGQTAAQAVAGQLAVPQGQNIQTFTTPSGQQVQVPTTLAPGQAGQVNQPTTQAQQPKSSYTGPSIVDYLASIGQPSDFNSRAILAKNAGIQNYTGTAAQNTQLLDTLRQSIPSTPAGSFSGGSTGTQAGGQGQGGQGGVTTGTAPQVPQTPQTFAETYKEALEAAGVNSIKSEFDKVQTEYDELQNKLNDEIAAINDNPWISEGLRSKKIIAAQNKYDGKLAILTNVLKLYDSLHQQAQIEARFIASGTQDQAQFDENMQLKLLELAQKESEALAKLDEPLSVSDAKALGVPFGTTAGEAYGITPKSTTNTLADLTPAQQSAAFKMAGDFEAASKGYFQQRDAYNRVVSSVQDPSAAGDLALIFNYMKVLDPGSTVREGEFATAQNSGSIPSIITARYNKVISGERLSQVQRTDFFNRATRLFDGAEQQQQQVNQTYSDRAAAFGIPPPFVVRDISSTGRTSSGGVNIVTADDVALDEAKAAGIEITEQPTGALDRLSSFITKFFGF